MIRPLPFKPAHLGRIRPGRFETLAIEGTDPRLIGAGIPIPGPAMSLADEAGAILGAAGIVPLWNGVGNAWVYASDALRARPFGLHRCIARGLALAIEHFGFHRVQLSVHREFARSQRWVERLGFRFEGEMRGYGPNGDTYWRYAKVRHVH